MIKRDDLIKEINSIIGKETLEKAEKKDELANGIQFYGNENVEKLTLGVSLNKDFLKEAVRIGSNFCIFHHGFDPKTYKSRYSLASQKRLNIIIKNNLTIAGYHYALDAHPTIGNNVTIAKLLDAKIKESLMEEWGYTAEFSTPQDVKKLAEKCSRIFEHDTLAIYTGPEKVKTIGIISGGGKPYDQHLAEMTDKGVELFISGESSESVPHKMKEMEINYFACGHYATEVFGVQELGKKLKTKFKNKLEIEFIDIHNPL